MNKQSKNQLNACRVNHDKKRGVCGEVGRYLHCTMVMHACFITKYEVLSRRKIGKRAYLNDYNSKGLMYGLNRLFESEVEISRIRVGKKQSFETLINEEALLLAKYLRNERASWNPRIPTLT